LIRSYIIISSVSVPEEAPFSSVVRYVAEEVEIINFKVFQFKVNSATSAVITNTGVGVNP
jgi:ubiquitin-fold modifier 1